jgi:uncharacterized protein DUF3572
MARPEAATREAAETLAVQAFTYLAGDPDRLGRFLALTGIGPERIRAAAAEPGFFAGVLDHIMSDEALLLGFADHAGIDPATVARARAVLGGPAWEREQP